MKIIVYRCDISNFERTFGKSGKRPDKLERWVEKKKENNNGRERADGKLENGIHLAYISDAHAGL